MRLASFTLLLLVVNPSALVHAQERVAEGEYRLEVSNSSSAPVTKTTSRWVLYGEASGHFRLESEIQGLRAGMRVVQVEQVSDQLVPTAIGYDFYRKDQQNPSITATCDISDGGVVCTGHSGKDEAVPNAPHKTNGPFCMWIEGLSSLDLPWLMDGGLNMAHLEKGNSRISMLVVSGGSGVMIGDALNIAALEAIGKPLTVIAPNKPIPWSFRSAEESSLEFVGLETMEFEGTSITVRRYKLNDKRNSSELWVTNSGLLIKLVLGHHSTYLLSSYKQFRKLIPELGIEKTAAEVSK